MEIRGDEYRFLSNGRSWGVMVFDDIDYLYMFFFWEGMGKRLFYEWGVFFWCFLFSFIS